MQLTSVLIRILRTTQLTPLGPVAAVRTAMQLIFCWYLLSTFPSGAISADEPMRVGMIGLDTSHAPAFAKLINQNSDVASPLATMRVVAAYPGGSPDLPSSRDRVVGFTDDLRKMGIQIVDSIEQLLTKVDAVLLESVDGRKHLEQAIPVFRAGKPMFIDKPLAANLTDALAIDRLAKHYQSRWFSSSSLRFSPSIIRYRGAAYQGAIHGADAWGPCALDATHEDLFWYGIHGVETLYTAMGTGCQQLVRVSTPSTDVVVGTWEGGRIGSFRGIRSGASGYGLAVFGQKSIELDAKYEGYGPLVEEIARFFSGGPHPVSNQETLEMMTFMQAAQVSKQRGVQPVTLSEVFEQHLAAAEEIVARIVDQP
ncbi:MAG: Gfo/Idh/MocA family oxidoreductase [Pirellulaceae bacterium]|nr:Gfo/Idh/MocA family oxidoreductase [Pirellulaceae bacterium]